MLNFRGMPQQDGMQGAYNNKTMVHNWWEDRFVPKDRPLDTTERVFSRDLRGDGPSFESTKQATDKTTMQAKAAMPKALPPKPSMYPSEEVVKERLEIYMPGGSPPPAVTYTLGRTMVQEANTPPDRHLQTTNQHFYRDLPSQDRTARPDMFPPAGAADKSKHFVATLGRELKSQAHIDDNMQEFAGGKGNRGPISRNPKESGNPYGVSVFVDEYGQWGQKLSGKVTLGETVSRKMTSYF